MRGKTGTAGRVIAFDLIRACSILWIVGLWHMFDYFPAYGFLKGDVSYLLTVGLLGSFVLISGFLMGRKEVSAAEFFRSRFARIYPPFLVACAAFGVLGLAKWQVLAKGAALIGLFDGPLPFTLWFIDMIVLFYAITPLLMRVRRRAAVYLALCVLLAVALVWAQAAFPGVSQRMAMYFPCYAGGLWLARGNAPNARAALIAGLALLVLGLPLTLWVPIHALENSVWAAPWAAGLALTLFGSAQMAERWMSGWIWPQPIAFASYFLYLFHRVVYALILKLVAHAGDGTRLAALVFVGPPLAMAFAWYGQSAYDRAWARLAQAKLARPRSKAP